MRAIIYDRNGDSDVLRLVERPEPSPGPGEVRVAVAYSGVNPTDWKRRRATAPGGEQVPNQDGSGVIDAVGDGVDRSPGRGAGLAARGGVAAPRRHGAASIVALDQELAVALPDSASRSSAPASASRSSQPTAASP